ncbi:GNAT family N-acetyltransferase [Bacillus niameyensis]|uniref:GNAT family N-acetyltransferase n=1 Tax=Bacillus niameyensis TaxID=1522308 RepID=UPI0009FE3474|nr:GNAT family N-acetyltransferase [Bacillus niameyensis]
MGISMLEHHDDPKIKIAGNIHYLWVEPEHRKNNIGKTIVARIIQFFKENGVNDLFLDYNFGNIEAEKFWGRLGYTPGIIVARNSIKNIEKKL